MLTVKLLADWFILSTVVYGFLAFACHPSGDLSRRGANLAFLAAQGIAAAILAVVA